MQSCSHASPRNGSPGLQSAKGECKRREVGAKLARADLNDRLRDLYLFAKSDVYDD